ncbi:hypothetical protein BH23ACT10_BH23ACT10_21530 [soil metagenome]
MALPALLDACSERWWRLPPRVRLLAIAALCGAVVLAAHGYVAQVQQRWGGPPRRALIAVDDVTVGGRPDLRSVLLPPAMVPPDAPRSVEPDVRLALALPKGGVLTRAHVSPRGPAVGLDPDLRVVPLPVEPGLDIGAGGVVDVWVLAATPGRSRRVASRRPVVGVTSDDGDDPTALVGLATSEVGAALRGLADGSVLLTQAPP